MTAVKTAENKYISDDITKYSKINLSFWLRVVQYFQ